MFIPSRVCLNNLSKPCKRIMKIILKPFREVSKDVKLLAYSRIRKDIDGLDKEAKRERERPM